MKQSLQPGEKQELVEERERLRFADEIRQNLTEAVIFSMIRHAW